MVTGKKRLLTNTGIPPTGAQTGHGRVWENDSKLPGAEVPFKKNVRERGSKRRGKGGNPRTSKRRKSPC